MDIMRAHLVISSCFDKEHFSFIDFLVNFNLCDCLRNKFQEKNLSKSQIPSCWAWRQDICPHSLIPEHQEVCHENNLHISEVFSPAWLPWKLTAGSGLHPSRDWPWGLVGWRVVLLLAVWVFIVPLGISSYGAHTLECRLHNGVGLSCPVVCGILVPQLEIKPTFPALESRFLTTGPLGVPAIDAIQVAGSNSKAGNDVSYLKYSRKFRESLKRQTFKGVRSYGQL